jgi:hypothetical protein
VAIGGFALKSPQGPASSRAVRALDATPQRSDDALRKAAARSLTLTLPGKAARAYVEITPSELIDLLDRVDAVRALHVVTAYGIPFAQCDGCAKPYPCPTVRALGGGVVTRPNQPDGDDTRDCLHMSRAYDVEHGPHWLQCDRTRGHEGRHHPDIYAGSVDEDDAS